MNSCQIFAKTSLNRMMVFGLCILMLFLSGFTFHKERLLIFNELNQQKSYSVSLVKELKSQKLNNKEPVGKDIIKSYTNAENNFNSLISQLKTDVMSGKDVADVNLIYKNLLENALSSATSFYEKGSAFIDQKESVAHEVNNRNTMTAFPRVAAYGVANKNVISTPFAITAYTTTLIKDMMPTVPEITGYMNNLSAIPLSLKSISEIVKDTTVFLHELKKISLEKRDYLLVELDKVVWQDYDKIK